MCTAEQVLLYWTCARVRAASTGIGGVGMGGVQTLATDEQELRAAQDKLEDSKRLAETAMFNVVNNEARACIARALLPNIEYEYYTSTLAGLLSIR